jgi:integrase
MKKRLPSQQRRGTTIAPRVYQDQWGITAQVEVAPFKPISKRFPRETDLKEIQAWQLRTRADLLDEKPQPLARGTLAADVPRFLETPYAGTGRKQDDYRYLLQAWIDATLPGTSQTFGDTHRNKITRDQIRTQAQTWQEAGIAASTINHRVRALRKLYAVLDGEDAKNPCDKVKKLREPIPESRDIPVQVVQLLLANLPDRGRPEKGGSRSTVSESKIRLRVMAWTGLPQMQLERLRERDVRFTTGELYRRPRRKGHGVAGSWTKLIPPAVEVLRDYAAANLWGKSFSRSSLRKAWKGTVRRTLKQAIAQAQQTGDARDVAFVEWLQTNIPEGCRPYDLKHAFGSEAYRQSGDSKAVKDLLQHASLVTTERYVQGAVSARVEVVIDKMSARWRPSSPPSPPATPTPRRRHGLRLIS